LGPPTPRSGTGWRSPSTTASRPACSTGRTAA